MVMNGITKASELSSKLPDILRHLESRLRNWKGGPWQLTSTKRTHFSIQFNMTRFSTESVKVDLLPTFEANVVDINGTYVTARVAALRSQAVALPIVDVPYYMKFWRNVNLAIFRKFWNTSHLTFAISPTDTLADYITFTTTIEHLCDKIINGMKHSET